MTQGLSYITKEGSDSLNRVPEGRWRPPAGSQRKIVYRVLWLSPPRRGIYSFRRVPAVQLRCPVSVCAPGGWPEAALQADRPFGRCMSAEEEEVIGAGAAAGSVSLARVAASADSVRSSQQLLLTDRD